MKKNNRRDFLKNVGKTALVVGTGSIWADVFVANAQKKISLETSASTLPVGTPIMVYIDLLGGCDTLNLHVPITDSWYYDNVKGRGGLAIQPAQALPLPNSNFGLHPYMPWLANRWTNKQDVAFVMGVGENVKNEFSHFAASEYRNTADFSYSEPRGWVGRFNDLAHSGNPTAAITLSNLHRSMMGGQTQILLVRDVEHFSLTIDSRASSGNAFINALSSMSTVNSTDNFGKASRMIANTLSSGASIRAATNTAYNNGAGSQSGLSWQMTQAAMMIVAGIPCQTYTATLGGFDTHGSQSWQHGDLLTQLNNALQKFFSIIDTSNRSQDVFVVIQSEFGRQITTNAGSGTDHGQAATAMIIGGDVQGGLYGEMPSLAPANRINDAMRATVDFRSFYATVLNRLGNNTNLTAEVLNGNFEDLGVF